MMLKLTINGQERELAVPPQTPLLNVLRNDLALNGPKYGCGLGECGACSVLIDGMAARTCVLPVSAAVGHDAQAAQCGYCLNGMIITIRALLNHNTQPSTQQIRTALEHNLCRCGTHVEILQAAERAVVINAAALQEASHE